MYITNCSENLEMMELRKICGQRGRNVKGKVSLLMTSSVISGVKGYHLMLADQLIHI